MRLPDVSLEARAIVGAVALTASVLGGVLMARDIARLPLSVIVVIVGMVGIWSVISVIVKQRHVIADQAARLAMATDTKAALLEIDERIEEGNELARQLKRYALRDTEFGMESDRDRFRAAVADWNERCVITAREHLLVAGSLGAPYRVDGSPNTRLFWRDSLLSEVTTKIARLERMQASPGR